jgi:hypothetical protein
MEPVAMMARMTSICRSVRPAASHPDEDNYEIQSGLMP